MFVKTVVKWNDLCIAVHASEGMQLNSVDAGAKDDVEQSVLDLGETVDVFRCGNEIEEKE